MESKDYVSFIHRTSNGKSFKIKLLTYSSNDICSIMAM